MESSGCKVAPGVVTTLDNRMDASPTERQSQRHFQMIADSWGIMPGRESDLSSLFSSVLRRENIFFISDAASSNFAWKWDAPICLMAFVTSLLACLYTSVGTTRPVFFRFFRSARPLTCLALMTASLIHGAGTVGNDFLFLWCVLVEEIQKGGIVQIKEVINIIGRAYHNGGLSDISSEQ